MHTLVTFKIVALEADLQSLLERSVDEGEEKLHKLIMVDALVAIRVDDPGDRLGQQRRQLQIQLQLIDCQVVFVTSLNK